MIADVIIDKPKPTVTNIQSYQWIQCHGLSTQIWWIVVAGSVPLLLIIFGVILAFKTRNVTYLWNEASQISLFFPSEIYMATFYISIIGIYFTASLALVVLFAPKFYNLWRVRHDDDDDDEGSFVIHGHGKFGQPALRGVTDIHQAARVAGIRGGGLGDDLGSGTFIRSPADLQTTPSTRPASADRSLIIPTTALPETDQLSAQEIAMPAANEHNQLDQVLGVATPISITDYSQRRYRGNSADGWVSRVIPKLDERGEVVSPTDNNRGVRDLKGTFIDSSEITAFRQLQGEGLSENIASSSSTVLPNKDSGNLAEQYSCHNEASMYPDIQQEEEVVVVPGHGAHRMLEAYAFHLPIRVQKSRLANLLSHWCMSTIILIPQAHAFLAVDSIDGKSSSHLMLSMTQVPNEGGDEGDPSDGKAKGVLNNYEPILRITTANSGSLLIRFASQARFDGWMGLFSDEDRVALVPKSSSAPSVFVRHDGYSMDDYSGQQQGQFSENEWRLTNIPLPPITNEQLLQHTVPHLMNTNNPEQPPQLQSYHLPDQIPFPESMDTIQEQAVRGQDLEGQYQEAPGDSTSLPYLIAQGVPQFVLPIPQNAQPPEQKTNLRPTDPILDEDDDEEDNLYDPEFGIGGNGQRRYRPRTKLCSDILSSGGGAHSRPISSTKSSISSGSDSSLPVIPSAAVISAAAAAVSVGWSESEALAAAMADPDLLLSKVTFNPTPPIPSNRRRIGSGISLSSSFRIGSSSKSRPLSSMNEAHSPSLPDLRQSSSSSARTRGPARSSGCVSTSSGRQDHIREPSATYVSDGKPEGSRHALTQPQSLSDRVLLRSAPAPVHASSFMAGDRLSSPYSSPTIAGPCTTVASDPVKNGGTITTFENWMMSHASEPAIPKTRLSLEGRGVDLVNAASLEEVVAPLSHFPVEEASSAALESSAL
ncbi:hypothetical protein BG006_008384, partial [Podila minutissima]